MAQNESVHLAKKAGLLRSYMFDALHFPGITLMHSSFSFASIITSWCGSSIGTIKFLIMVLAGSGCAMLSECPSRSHHRLLDFLL